MGIYLPVSREVPVPPRSDSSRRSPADVLPLTPVVLEILLALADGECHGYHIMRSVESRTDGRLTLHAGTLYRALARMLDHGLTEELDERPDTDDERRRYYRLSRFGIRVADAEASRLPSKVRAARGRRLLRREGC